MGTILKNLFFGEPMKRGSLNCQRCNSTRNNRLCLKCGYDAYLIRITWEGKTYRFWHNQAGNPYSFAEASKALHTINNLIDARRFDPKDYLTATIKEMKFSASFGRWMDVKAKGAEGNRLSFETLRAYRSYYKNHFRPLYALDIREIKLRDLQDLLDKLPGSLSLNFRRRLFQ
jgi:hypothetical protein